MKSVTYNGIENGTGTELEPEMRLPNRNLNCVRFLRAGVEPAAGFSLARQGSYVGSPVCLDSKGKFRGSALSHFPVVFCYTAEDMTSFPPPAAA
jgi:hypothetical protein